MPADVSEMRQLAKDLRTAAATSTKRASVAVRKALFDIERLAKMRVPVRTGNLRNSIGTDIDAGGLGGVVGPTAAYGGFVEFGTSKMGAQPYMNPAADAVIPKLQAALKGLAKL